MTEKSIEQVAAQLRALCVRRGGVLLVHTPFRAVRPVEGSPRLEGVKGFVPLLRPYESSDTCGRVSSQRIVLTPAAAAELKRAHQRPSSAPALQPAPSTGLLFP